MRDELKPAYIANIVAVVINPLLWFSGYIFGVYDYWIELVIVSPLVFGVIALVTTITVFWHVGFHKIRWPNYLLFLVQPIGLLVVYRLLAFGLEAI